MVGVIPHDTNFRPDASEVASVFHAPLRMFLEGGPNHDCRDAQWQDIPYRCAGGQGCLMARARLLRGSKCATAKAASAACRSRIGRQVSTADHAPVQQPAFLAVTLCAWLNTTLRAWLCRLHYWTYRFGGKEYLIWGLTAGILISVAERAFGCKVRWAWLCQLGLRGCCCFQRRAAPALPPLTRNAQGVVRSAGGIRHQPTRGAAIHRPGL